MAGPQAGVILASDQGPDPSIVASRDGGRNWATVYRGPSQDALSELGFTSATQGVAIVSTVGNGEATLLMTHDGGRSWQPVALGH